MKKSNAEIYKELRKKYSDNEIAESFVFPSELSEEEQKKSNEEFSKFLKEHRKKNQKIIKKKSKK